MNDRKNYIITKFLLELLDLYEFELWVDTNSNSEKIFRLNDLQGANWSWIENDEFNTLADVIERLDSPHNDYIYNSLEERMAAKENIPKNDWDLTAKRYLESDTVAEILSNIDAQKYKEIVSEQQKYEISDLIKILDAEESAKKYYDLSLSKVIDFFKENNIKDLMDYGSDCDEGLNHLSSMYEEILDKLNIKYSNVYTEDVSDGKYLTIITLQDNSQITVDTSAWNGIKVVTENIESIYEKWNSIQEKAIKEQAENEISYL